MINDGLKCFAYEEIYETVHIFLAGFFQQLR